MRGCFLDFDGPLHPVSEIADQRSKVSSADLPHLVKTRGLFRWLPILERALENHDDVVIVVHSGWRGLATNSQLKEFLGPLAPRFIGITSIDMPRYEGIVDFAARAGLDSYRIIDDAAHEFPAKLHELVLTDPELGLSEGAPCDALADWLLQSAPQQVPVPARQTYS